MHTNGHKALFTKQMSACEPYLADLFRSKDLGSVLADKVTRPGGDS